ncbi:hypothetical protein CVV38_01400 [Candidatus Peregrinibacteria bacterium HGW-Peregrinibacteria-1]|jgi:hypothetical protein|nr:MAG: hypothetical protein CVV38_01400 [Candidatus Peregrinibacteria bacterium HGW-Peregrinibacteria-1]
MKKVFSLAFMILLMSQGVVSSGQNWFEDIDDIDSQTVGAVRMEAMIIEDSILKVDVVMDDFKKPVLGVSFDLLYDEELRFLRYEPGEYLEQGGMPIYMVSESVDSSKSSGFEVVTNKSASSVSLRDEYLVYGVTLKRDDSFPLGSGTLTSFYFELGDGKDFQLDFRRGVVSTLDTVRQDLDLVAWSNAVFDRAGKNITEDFDQDGRQSEAGKSSFLSNNLGSFVMGGLFLVLIIIAYRLFKMRRLSA